jgi:hypothetical protein
MDDHYIQKQQYHEYMNELENLSNINYNHSFENGSLSEICPASQYPAWGASTKSTYCMDIWQDGSQKNDCCTM